MAERGSADRPIYAKGEVADGAYIVTRGSLKVDFGSGVHHLLPAQNVVVGTLELMLPEVETRLFSLEFRGSSKIASIDERTVREMITGFRFGYNTNIFLAQVLGITNDLYIEADKKSKRVLRDYRRRAELLVKMVDVLAELAERHRIPTLVKLAEAYRQEEMYTDGSAYRRPNIIHAVLSPPTARSRFVELFKKNTLICREGGMGKKMYVLLEGKISVSSGGNYVGTIEQAGEAFGELALFLDGRRTATLVAEEDSHVYVVEHSNIRQFVRYKCPSLFLHLAESLSARILQNLNRIERLKMMMENEKVPVESGLTPSSKSQLGRVELMEFLKMVRHAQQESPKVVLRSYIEQYSKQIARTE